MVVGERRFRHPSGGAKRPPYASNALQGPRRLPIILHLQKHPVLYRDYLAPSTLAKLNSALQRPDISDDFRSQITEILPKYE